MGYEESIKCALDAGANGRVKKLVAEADAEIERLREALSWCVDQLENDDPDVRCMDNNAVDFGNNVLIEGENQ